VATAEGVRLPAPAKVNLFLHILERATSGYHGLETLFCAISLADEVEVRRAAAGIALAVEGSIDTGVPAANLCVRAAEAFHRRIGSAPAVEIVLRKRIPSGAGLGGGSSDAATTLAALNELHGEPLGRGELLAIAAGLGADVPFFLCGSPLALGWSRGDRLLALPPLPARPVLVVHPGVAMPTADAFRRLAARRGEGAPPARAIPVATLGSWEALAPIAANDFEAVARDSVPAVPPLLARLRDAGATTSLLAGSGACVFGVFADAAARDSARGACEGEGFRCWSADTLAGG
jgi:4-diphosphocytidyl-2-C-methyl-D-erythritol kinase